MIFFSFVMAPLIFTKLEGEVAGRFIRAVFPWYYLFLGILSLFSFITLLFANRIEAIVMILFLLGVVVSRQIIYIYDFSISYIRTIFFERNA